MRGDPARDAGFEGPNDPLDGDVMSVMPSGENAAAPGDDAADDCRETDADGYAYVAGCTAAAAAPDGV